MITLLIAAIILLAASCLTSAVVTRLVLVYARSRLLDIPNARSSHAVPTPRGGGLGLVAGLLLAWLVFCLFIDLFDGPTVMVAGGAVCMAGIGWWDDHSGLTARLRLTFQLTITGIIAWSIGVPTAIGLADWQIAVLPWLYLLVATVGSAWMVNLTNFMDGIDGIAGMQGVMAGGFAAILLLGVGADPGWPALGVATAGASLGFLCLNWPPARIFMGDVGSTALGLVFAVLVLVQVRNGIAVDIALLPLAPFIFDTLGTLVRRILRKENVSEAHRSHLYQRLARYWGSHRLVTFIYGFLAAVGGLGAVAAQRQWVPAILSDAVVWSAFAALALYGRLRCPA